MIQERADYKSLDPADILERLTLMSSSLLRRETSMDGAMAYHALRRPRQYLDLKVRILVAALVILKN